MAYYWFISAPLKSHTDWGGMLPTAIQLRRTGHKVVWLSGHELKPYLKAAPITYETIANTGWLWPPPQTTSKEMLPQEMVQQRYTRALDTWMSVPAVRAGTQDLLERATQIGTPQVIVSDPFLPAAALAAEHLRSKFAVAGIPALRPLDDAALFPVQRQLAADSRSRLAQLCEEFAVTGEHFSSGAAPSVLSHELHLCFFSRKWYLADEQNLLPQNSFFGGRAIKPPSERAPGWLKDIPPDAPLALITLGTTFTGDLGFYAWAAQAAARVGLLPIVTLGMQEIKDAEKAELLAALPRNSRLLQWIPFPYVLPRVKLAFHHGGIGTTHALLVHGIPQIVVPHAADQRAQARRVAQAKVGLHLSAHDVRQGMLTEAAQALLSDQSVLERVSDFAKEMAKLGGPEQAAMKLQDLAATNE